MHRLNNRKPITQTFFPVCFALALLVLALPIAEGATDATSSCLGCHGVDGMEMTLGDGSTVNITIPSQTMDHSVHPFLGCADCHVGFSDDEHPYPSFENRRSLSARWVSACRQCHSFESGVHATLVEAEKGLLCTDCHGSHAITKVAGQNDCLGCHSHTLSLTFGNGVSGAMQVHADVLEKSIHGSLRCVDCHFGFSGSEHPERSFFSPRDMTISHADSCRRCHFDKYTRSLESIHYAQLSQGNLKAPVCVDCHGSHAIQGGIKDKIASAGRCRKCHEDIYDTYAKSVHGKVLLEGVSAPANSSNSSNFFANGNAVIFPGAYNQDVPVCADCHSAHEVSNPHEADFRNNTPQMCGNCHADKELMTRHGLSTSVVDSYLEDFHGVTLSFYKDQGYNVRRIAVCTDCHGIHDITRTDGPESSVVKEKLLQRCRNCHPDAEANFPDAWISHYEPSMQRASLVWLVNLIYDIFIPFMIVGLILQILLHIWRYAVNR